jgi:hypothetical protein
MRTQDKRPPLRVDGPSDQGLEVGAQVVGVQHRLCESPSGKAHQTHSYQCEENLAKRFAEDSVKRVLAIAGAATGSDRSQPGEYSNDRKDQPPRSIADPRHPLEPSSLPQILCFHPTFSSLTIPKVQQLFLTAVPARMTGAKE